MIALLVTLVLALSAAASGVVYASDGAGPGDTLYGIDRAVEALRLQLASGDEAKAELHLKFASERLEEAEDELSGEGDGDEIEIALSSFDDAIATLEALLESGAVSDEQAIRDAIAQLEAARDSAGLGGLDEIEIEVEVEDGSTTVEVGVEPEDDQSDEGAEVEVTGTLDAIDDQTVTIDGQTYDLIPETEIEGLLEPGTLVKVHLTTLADGTLVVRGIEAAEGDESEGEDDSSDDSLDEDEDDSSFGVSGDDLSSGDDHSGDDFDDGGDDHSGSDSSGDDHSDDGSHDDDGDDNGGDDGGGDDD